jgi:hypothetical protein
VSATGHGLVGKKSHWCFFRLYILFLASIAAQIPNGVVSNFSSIIISGFGFTQLQTTLLDIPNSLVQITSLVLSGYFAGRFKNSRAIMMASPRVFAGPLADVDAASLTNPVHRQRHMYHRCGMLDLRAKDLPMGPPRRVLVHVVPVRRLLA